MGDLEFNYIFITPKMRSVVEREGKIQIGRMSKANNTY